MSAAVESNSSITDSQVTSSHLLSALSNQPQNQNSNSNNAALTQPTEVDQNENQSMQQSDLWSSILNSVKSERAVPSRNLIVLGEPSTGKSTLLSLLSKNSPNSFMSNLIKDQTEEIQKDSNERIIDEKNQTNRKNGGDDLGLSYGYFDVGEGSLGDGDEIIARLGIYKLSSSHPSYISLLPLSLPSTSSSSSSSNHHQSNSTNNSSSNINLNNSNSISNSSKTKGSIETLKDSLILITLDWENPVSFLEQLRTWLDVIKELINGVGGNGLKSDRERESLKSNGTEEKFNKEKIVLEEMMEKLEIYIRSYNEPQSSIPISNLSLNESSNSKIEELPTPSTNNSYSITSMNQNAIDGLNDDILPLGDGTLTNNFGVGIVVVCTKADTISRLERERGFKEEQFDYIQQVLRTICLKYGAALFYTARTRPESIEILRSYILHRLFTPNQSQSQSLTTSNNNNNNNNSSIPSTTTTTTSSTTTFPFPHKASTIERDILLVPSGWDSFGKINALREGFDCKSMGNGWEFDCEIESVRREKGIEERNRKVDEGLEKELNEKNGNGNGNGEDDRGSAVRWFEDVVADWKAIPLVDSNQTKIKPPDEQQFLSLHHSTLQKDEDPRSKFSRTTSSSSKMGNVVGPMGSSALSLPSVEKVVNDGSRDGYREERSDRDRDREKERDRDRDRSDKDRHRDRDRESERATPRISRKESRSARLESPSLGSSNGPSSPGSTSPGVPKQSEVLHDFFQSLLKPGQGGTPRSDRDRERRGTGSSPKPPSNSNSNPKSDSTDSNLTSGGANE